MSIRWSSSGFVVRSIPLCLVIALFVVLAPAASAACGNSVIEVGEDCDDGSSSNGGFHSCCSSICKFSGKSPDVIVGDIPDISRYTSSGGITPYAIGTTSCNIGTCWLNWFSSINEHPVIGQNMFRLKDGRFEHLGQSWLKHGFTALNGNICSASCPTGAGGSHLGVNCSDPYSSGLNGDQGRLGPKWEVNPSTGVYPYPFTNGSGSGSLYKRLQVKNTDLDPALNTGALYFVEGQYVTHDDTVAKNHANNASYRRVTVGSAPYDLTLQEGTVRQSPAIKAWKTTDAAVTETTFAGGDGTWIMSAKATALGGGVYHYEYALHNLTAHRAGQSFSVPIPAGATITNVGFHDVDYHSGEPFVGTDWTMTVSAGAVTWETQTFAVNPNANALRWGTLYNFRFDANRAPGTGLITLGLFKPGTPTSITASTVLPAACAATETICGDGLDQDCDGQIDCLDADCCTSGACAGSDLDGDHFAAVCDCNDASAAIYPGAPQTCDGVNNNCSAPGWPALPANELDADGDGLRACSGDCDDTSATTYPGALQYCDGINNNCNAPGWPAVPANEADGDQDGARICDGDCDDADPLRYPDNVETCDGLDNDCQAGLPANELDGDADGVRGCAGDCDDTEPASYPGNPEVCDGIDNDCAGGLAADELDADADGVMICAGDCDDTDNARYPGNPEACDGIDNDCVGGLPPDELDANLDGLIDCQTDCDPANASVWGTPGEVRSLALTQAGGVTTLGWDAPPNPGSTAPRYDTLRSDLAEDFVNGAECIEADGTDLLTYDSATPDLDKVRYYLVRCENDCPLGEGTLGLVSDQTPRVGRLCP